MTMRNSTKLLGLCLALAFAAAQAQGAVYYKDVTSTDMNALASWSTTRGADTPDPTTAITGADSLRFDQYFAPTSGTMYTASLSADLTVGSVRSDYWTTGTAFGNITIAGAKTLTLMGAGDPNYGTSGIVLNAATGGTLTINSNLALGAAQSWTLSRALTVNGNLNLGSYALTVGTYSASTATINGAISGSGALTKTQNGTLILAGGNASYTGSTTVSTGELQVLSSTAAGAKTGLGTGAVTVNSGATLRLKTGSTGNAQSYANAINLNNATLISEDGVVTYGGAVTLTGVNTINVIWGGKNAIFSSAIGGTGSLTKTGSGDLILNAAGNSLTSLTVNQGKVAIGGSGSLAISGAYLSSATSSTGSLDIAAGGSLTAGSLLSAWGTNMAINGTLTTGAFTFSGGASTVTGSGTAKMTSLTNTNYGTTNLNGARFNIGSGGYTVTSGTTAINFGATTIGAWADWSSSAPMALTNSTTGTTINTLDSVDGTTARNITLSGVLSGSGKLNKSGAGTLTLTAANTYTGATAIAAGTLEIGGSGSLGSGSYAGNISNAGALLVSTTANQTLSGTISGAGTLTKSGSGTLTLTADNTFTGKVAINGGTVSISRVANLGARGTYRTLELSNGGVLHATDNMMGDRSTEGDQSAFQTRIFKLGPNASGETFAGVIDVDTAKTMEIRALITPLNSESGAGLKKAGAGTLLIARGALGDYTGPTTVAAGTLVVDGSIASSSLTTVNAGATLMGSGTVGATTVNGTLAPGNSIGRLIINGDLVLAGTSDFEIDPNGVLADLADLAAVSGNLTYGGTLNVTNIGGAFSWGDTFNLFDWAGALTGNFTAVYLPTLTNPAWSWQNNLTLDGTITVVPEPAATLGLALLLSGALLRRRRHS